MILYLDTSALVKLYIKEQHRELVSAANEEAEFVTTSTVAYAEARAALARQLRTGNLDDHQRQQEVANLDADWLAFLHLEVSNTLTGHAGELAQAHTLRGFDAIHLASALHFAKEFDDLRFLAFDKRLNDAAREASLTTYGDSTIPGLE